MPRVTPLKGLIRKQIPCIMPRQARRLRLSQEDKKQCQQSTPWLQDLQRVGSQEDNSYTRYLLLFLYSSSRAKNYKGVTISKLPTEVANSAAY